MPPAQVQSKFHPDKFCSELFFADHHFGSRVPPLDRRNWEAGANPALPRNCKRVSGGRPLCKREGPRRCSRFTSQLASQETGANLHQPLSRAKEECLSIIRVLLVVAVALHSRARLRSQNHRPESFGRPGFRRAGQPVSRQRQCRSRCADHRRRRHRNVFPRLADGDYRAVIFAPGFAEQSRPVHVPQTEALTCN